MICAARFLKLSIFPVMLAGLGLAVPSVRAGQGHVVISEVMYNPPDGRPEYVELVNLTSNRYDVAKWRVSGGISYEFPDFSAGAASAHFVNEYERVVLSSADAAATRAAYPGIPASVRIFGPWTGSLNNAGDTFELRDAAGAIQCGLTYDDGDEWPLSPDGAGHSLQVIDPDREVDNWRNWRASAVRLGTPGYTEPTVAEQAVANPEVDIRPTVQATDYGSTWKFWRELSDPDGAGPEGSWKEPGFPDGEWQSGAGLIGNETNAVITPLMQTNLATGYDPALITYYFRTTFSWTGALTGNSFVLDQWVDDGVVYYLNGRELNGDGLGRVRMNVGVPTHTTGANATPPGGDAIEELAILSGSLDGFLVSGTNVLCAEVHQTGAGSSDVVFGARFRIQAPVAGGVVINEVQPGAAGAGFVEFFNPGNDPVDLSGWYVSDSAANLTKTKLAGPLVVPAKGLVTVGFAESGLTVASPLVVILTRPDGVTRQSMISSTAADNRALGRKPTGSSNWFLFTQATPGAPNESTLGGGGSPVRLSEVHFSPAGRVDWVELYNAGSASAPLAGLGLAGRADQAGRVALTGTLAPGGYLSVPVDFPADNNGDVIVYLTGGSGSVLGAAAVEDRRGLPSVQVWPAGGSEWYASPTDTRDAANDPERSEAIVINEIMFDPPSRQTQAEFVELTNRSAVPVNLSGWRFNKGIDYDFPAGVVLAPGEFLVVAKDPAWIAQKYGAGVRVYGPYDGTLRNSGERIRLEDARQNLADTVDYKTGGQWPVETDSAGSSLELLHPDMDNSQPSAWRASDESGKAQFQPYSYTGAYKQLRGAPTAVTAYKELLFNLVSDGHVVLRNIRLTTVANPSVNLIPNGDATSHGTGTSVNGFLCTGTHCLSDTLPDGFHLLSYGGGDTKANKAEVDVTAINGSAAAPGNYTLSFEARWVSGLPLMVAQTWDRSFGKVFRFPVPDNLGTPGSVNSRVRAAAAPTVDGLVHSPAVPRSTDPVVVRATVRSAVPLSSVLLWERLDNTAGTAVWNSRVMNDAGTDGDAVAGDGEWAATIPPRADSSITQFYVEATAGQQKNEAPRNPRGIRGVNGSVLGLPERPAMYIVDNSPPVAAPGLNVQRFVLSQYHRNALNPGTGFSSAWDWDHQRMSNFGWNCTVIINERDVRYNGEIRRGGSPWTRTGNNSLERARWRSPGDDMYRMQSKWGIDSDGTVTNTAGRFHNRMTRYMMYLMGHPVPQAEFVQWIVNQDAPSFRDAMEMTDTDFFERAYGDGGELYEIDDSWFMYDTNNHDDRLDAGSVTGRWSLTDWTNVSAGANPSDESPIFFHGNWPLRFPEPDYDGPAYASLASFMKVVYNNNSGAIANDAVFREQVTRSLDLERVALYTAVRGYVGDWDNFTLNRGKNGYFFRRPGDGKFEFHHWDSDLAFQNAGEGFIGTAGGIGWQNLSNRPWFRQRYSFYLSELVGRFTQNSPRMTAYLASLNYQSSNPNGLAPFKTSAFSYPGWFSSRQSAAITSINSMGGANYTRAFAVTTANNQSVTNPVFTLAGSASSRTVRVEVAGHPEAVFAWVPTTANLGLWTLSGIVLANGVNTLVVNSLDGSGAVSATVTITATLTGNSPPVARLVGDPPTLKVAANELLLLDGSGSFDPEGSPLAFRWQVTPESGWAGQDAGAGRRQFRFFSPGIFTVSMTVTDASGATAVQDREVVVYNAADYTGFSSGDPLPAGLTARNVERAGNFPVGATYSLEDFTGRFVIEVRDTSALPLATVDPKHPVISRDLPDGTDFVLQTQLEPMTREFGNWQSGLWMQMREGGETVNYVFSLDGGTSLQVRRGIAPSPYTFIGTVTGFTGRGATLRVRRSGLRLLFDRFDGAVWRNVTTQTLPEGATALTGGLMVSTSTATNARTGFDYLMVADYSAGSPVLAALRITEVHYNPAPGGVEFIELRNTGMQTLDLTGVSFGIGQPFSMGGVPEMAYRFGAELLAPGEFLVIPEDAARFRTVYGNGIRLAPQWASGGLANGGEQIQLLDAAGNAVHDFGYDDAPPWPVAADGSGPSMEVVDVNGVYGDGTNWRASAESGGNPGRLGAGPDTDGDGIPDSHEALFGTDPASGGSVPAVTVAVAPGTGAVTLSWPSAPGIRYTVQTATGLQVWTDVQTVTGVGSFTYTPEPGEARRYYRVVATRP